MPENSSMQTPCFTLPYAPPEVLSTAAAAGCREKTINGYSESCNLWSLGVILVTTLTVAIFESSTRGSACPPVF